MTFISYAQNYEDVILYRALKGVGTGFYIDVGAQDPIVDSVTKAFYERGWRGINIEPVDYWFNKLLAERPEDYNLKVAAAAETGTLTFYEVVGTGMSTSDASLAAKHGVAGFDIRQRKVPTRSLNEICNELGVTEIHFLKIDVEGAESAVLEGLDLNRFRPWIILIESTEPNSTAPTHAQWQELLTSQGFVFVHFDGLNRYYVPREREGHLREVLSTPPNYFDQFIRYSEWWAGQHAQRMEAELTSANNRLQTLDNELAEIKIQSNALRESVATVQKSATSTEEKFTEACGRLQIMEDELAQSRKAAVELGSRLHEHEAELAGVYRSLSWRMTTPLRKANLLVRQSISKIKPGVFALTNLPGQILRWVLLSVLTHLQARPGRKSKVAHLIALSPTLDKRLRAFSRAQNHLTQTLSGINCINPRLVQKSLELPTSAGYQSSSSSKVTFPLKRGCRYIYYYVDHTILCPVNTGMQRVARCLGRALLEQGEEIHFVKWNAHYQQFVLLNQEELKYFSQWSGPLFSAEDLQYYPLPDAQPPFVGRHILDEGHWLIIPEVTHITYHTQPVTLDIIMAAKHSGLKTAFVYYDAIPLRLRGYAESAPNHEIYMQQLLLADLVVPISKNSEQELTSFFRIHEEASLTPPRISAIPLPGESHLAPRVTKPAVLGETRKLILSVGSIEPRKNQVALVHAFERFCEAYPMTDWELVLAGNLRWDVANEVNSAIRRNHRIKYCQNISDTELDALYRSCAFTVFPSVDEGFGLPILESLWYAKPCICADFGAMREVAEGGGCLTIDVRDIGVLSDAIMRMIMEPDMLFQLSSEAAIRPITSWSDYARSFSACLDEESDPLRQLGTIYYWVDDTATRQHNSGIQRVVRQLARSMIEIGLKLVPVKWDLSKCRFYSPTVEELQHLARWNGPQPSDWSPWADPSNATPRDWILVTELTHINLDDLKRHARTLGLRCAAIFYDAIPWKMHNIFPPNFSQNHRIYMEGLNAFEKVFPISNYSRADLTEFLRASHARTLSLDDRVQACVLPGEFLETARVMEVKPTDSTVIKIFSVISIEPRKNPLGLLRAFTRAVEKSTKPVELVLVGRRIEAFADLAQQVANYVETTPNIRWEQEVDDAQLLKLYAACDFTIFPSLEEGFGLPVLESLWNARPCLCHNSGAMAEVAEGGGCLTVDVSDSDALTHAILRLIEDDEVRLELARAAIRRSFKTWSEYAREIATCLATERFLPQGQMPGYMDRKEFYEKFVNLRPRPLLSICISTYNRAEWLALSLRNLERLLPKPNNEIEIVVCDNTSTDHTPEVVQPYLKREDFHYYRNQENVGMLGNLRVTVHHARGRYVWILGDDDLVKPGGIEKVLRAIRANTDTSLVYLNYAYTRVVDAKAVSDLDSFLENATPVVAPGTDIVAPIRQFSTMNENFFTAIYCLVFRRDHALRAYSQNTEGRPFSTMLTCIPTTSYVLHSMMNEPGYWLGEPIVVVNFNVSWMKYASLWSLERVPEALELAERMGADPMGVDRWRVHIMPGIVHYFSVIFENDQESNAHYFSALRLVSRMKHLDKFRARVATLRDIYDKAHSQGRPGADIPTSRVFVGFED